MENKKPIENLSEIEETSNVLAKLWDKVKNSKETGVKVVFVLIIAAVTALMLYSCAATAGCKHTLEIDGKKYEFGTAYEAESGKK
ncbi:hypothetical protein [Dipodfec virus UOA04_Rod_661]|nr:hypothetical protein [Dipodfec virus UOA04_Rod_661]